MKALSTVFWVLAVLLSHVMCVVVTWNYCIARWGRVVSSAPPSTAFLLAIPYLIGIGLCVLLAIVFRRKAGA